MRLKGLLNNVDWLLVGLYFLMVFIGIINIYASINNAEETSSLFALGGRSGKQIMWFGISICCAALILFVINPRAYEGMALFIYLAVFVLLVAVIFLGADVKGSHSWFSFGSVRFQPAEVSKISTSLLLAAYMGRYGFKMNRLRDFLTIAAIIGIPMLTIVLQSETGSALVYVGFLFVLYREGLTGWLISLLGLAIVVAILSLTHSIYVAIMTLVVVVSLCNCLYCGKSKRWFMFYLPVLLLLGFLPLVLRRLVAIMGDGSFVARINPVYVLVAVVMVGLAVALYFAFRKGHRFTYFAAIAVVVGMVLSFSTDVAFHHGLKKHQRERIEQLLGLSDNPLGVGYNVRQSMIAIGSGGFTGKGYLNGTQTTYGFVPEQSTDFIFCTVGEEWGFVGSASVILIFAFMIYRIIRRAEQSKEAFTRIYGYCVASCLFMHLLVNVSMTIGLMPVIGIPLPFVSYGGSSLLTFTVLLFIFIALDCNDRQYSN